MLKKDIILDRQVDIEAHVLEFYTSLFASDNACIDNGLIDDVVSPEVSAEDSSQDFFLGMRLEMQFLE